MRKSKYTEAVLEKALAWERFLAEQGSLATSAKRKTAGIFILQEVLYVNTADIDVNESKTAPTTKMEPVS